MSTVLGSTALVENIAARPVPQIERMLGATAGTDGLDDALDMPITIASLDVDPAAGVVRSEQHRGLPAPTLPAEEDALRRIDAVKPHGVCSLSHHQLPPRQLTNYD